MADRTVSVKLELDIASYLANLRAAESATKKFGDGGASGTKAVDAETKTLAKDIEDVGKKSDEVKKKTDGNETANQHSYSQTRGMVLAITALLTNLPAIVAPALGLLLAVPGAIALAGVAAGTTAISIKGVGDAVKALDSNDVKKISKAMDELSPAAQAFAREVTAVRDEWDGLRNSVQQEMFTPIVGKLTQLGTTILPMLNVELPQVGRSIGNIAAGFADWLSQTETVNRVAFLLNDVRTQLDHVLPVLKNWSNAFLDISHVAAPFLVNLLDILSSLGARFVAFINTAKASGQLDTIFKTTTLGVQQLLDVLSKLADALFTILASPGTLQAARVLFGALNLIAGAIDAIAHAFALLPGPVQATLLVMLAVGGVLPLLAKGFSAVHTAMSELGKKFSDIRSGIETAASSSEKLGTSLSATGRASNVAKGALGGLMGALGGPWGLAVSAAVVGLSMLAINMGEQKMKAEQAAQAYFDFGEAVAAARAKGEDETASLIQHHKEIQDLIIDAHKFGISASDVTNALSGEQGAIDRVNEALARRRSELIKTIAEHTTQSQKSGAVMDDTARKAKTELDQIDRLGVSFDTVTKMQARATEATDLYTKSLGANAKAHEGQAALYGNFTALLEVLQSKTATAAQRATAFTETLKNIAATAGPAGEQLGAFRSILNAVDGSALSATERGNLFKAILGDIVNVAAPLSDKVGALGHEFWLVADAELSAGQKADLLKQTWEAMSKPATDQTNATQDFNLALLTLGTQIDKTSTSLDINKAAGIKNRQAVEGLIEKNDALFFANVASGMSAEEAAKKHADNGLKIEDAGHRAGLATNEVRGLNLEYGHIPDKASTLVEARGVDAVLEQLRTLKIAQIALDKNISVTAATAEFRLSHQTAGAAGSNFAQGGPVRGPGTGTSDSVWARIGTGDFAKLSDGEHIVTAAEVKAAGGHEAIMAWRRMLMGRSPRARFPGDGSGGLAFAGGGPVQWPFPVDASQTKMPFTMAELKARYAFGPGWSGPIPANVAPIQKWLHDQAGAPYLWNQAGPGGWDCSGLVSSVWLLMHGKTPYNHLFSTSNEAPYFPIPGWGVLTAGWTNPGEPGPGGNDVGHTAGVLAGLPFESRGGAGVVVGAGVTPVNSFAHVGHFDKGGWLQPGVTIAVNTTGHPERVSSGSDGATMQIVGRMSLDVGGGQTLRGIVRGEIQSADKANARSADLLARGG